MDLVKETKIWSRSFWLSKLVRLLILGLLVVLLTQLWNWESQQENSGAEVVVDDSSQQQAQEEVKEPEPPAFPYEISLPEGVTGPVETTEASFTAYTYRFADGATMTVYPAGAPESNTDVVWTHTTDAANKLDVGPLPTTLCAVGTVGCAAGNGNIDITSKHAEGQADNYVIKISDSNISVKTFEEASAQYLPIIESIEVNR